MLDSSTPPTTIPAWYLNIDYSDDNPEENHRYLRRVVKYLNGNPVIIEKGITHDASLDYASYDDEELRWVWIAIEGGHLKDHRDDVTLTKARIQ